VCHYNLLCGKYILNFCVVLFAHTSKYTTSTCIDTLTLDAVWTFLYVTSGGGGLGGGDLKPCEGEGGGVPSKCTWSECGLTRVY